MTEVGGIPKDWEVKTLGEVCNVKGRIGFRGYTKKDLVDKGFGAITLSPSNINDNHELDTKDATYISWFKYEESPEIKVYNNDILFVKTGSTYGKSALVKGLKEKATINPQFALLKDISCEPPFLASVITQPIIQKQVELSVVGGAIPTMSQQKISEFVFPFPPTSEQRRIAQVLSDTDSLIASLSRTIEKKRLMKQGAMQQLLTGKTRLKGFSGEWVEKKLGDIADIRTGKRNGDENVIGGLYPFFVRSQEVLRINSYSYEGEAIIVPGEGGIGKIFHYVHGKFDYHQRVYKVSDFPSDICTKYVYYYMTQFFGDYALNQTAKATVDSLRLPTFQEFEISMPDSWNEQFAIANILTTMDNEIASLEAELQKYKALKQGMMQKLLTGQIRLTDSTK